MKKNIKILNIFLKNVLVYYMIAEIVVICVTGCIIIRYSYKYYRNYINKKRQNEFLNNEIYRSSQIFAEL